MTREKTWLGAVALLLSLACTANPIAIVTPDGSSGGGNGGAPPPSGERGRVVDVIDGDTIDVNINGEVVRVRYLGMNTTERGELCYDEGTMANAALVSGETVTLVPDEEREDRYGRALRYVYVGNTFVNAELVRQGWAEAVVYEPNDAHWDELVELEKQAARDRRGCHGITDIFDDGTYRR